MSAGATAVRRPAAPSRTVAIAAAGIASIAGALIAGLGLGGLLSADAPAPTADRVVQAGDARLVVPLAWVPTSLNGAGIAGLEPGSAVALAPSRGGPERIVATVGRAGDPSLIAPELRALLAAPPPAPRGARLG